MSDVGQSSKLRILCLHGFLQSGEVFWSRIGSLRKGLKSRAEFIVVDAPHKIDGSFDEQLQAAGGTRDSPRAWFRWEVGPGTLWLHDACNGHTSRSSCVDENMTLHAGCRTPRLASGHPGQGSTWAGRIRWKSCARR